MKGVFRIMSWRWLTLTWVIPHYHQREEVSLLSSGRDQVVHSCYGRQHNCYGLVRVLVTLLLLDAFACNALLGSKWVINRLAIGSEVYCLAFTKSSFCLIVRSIWNRLILTSFEVRTTTVWVLYSQASRAISIGQLHISLCFHIQPINVVVFNGSLGDIKSQGNLILR